MLQKSNVGLFCLTAGAWGRIRSVLLHHIRHIVRLTHPIHHGDLYRIDNRSITI